MNLGMLGALGGAADSASAQLGAGIKEDAEMRMMNAKLDIENRLRDAEEVRKQRAAEYKQQMAKQRGSQIDTEAKGILNSLPGASSPVMSIEGDSGDTVKGGTISREFTPIEESRARAKAARKLGMLDDAKEEDINYRNLMGDERNQRLDEHNIRRDEATAKYQEGMLKNNAEKIASMFENGQLKAQLAQANAEKKLPEEVKLAIQGRYKAVEEVFKDTSLDEAGRTERITAINKTFGPQLVKQVEVNDKTGATTVHSWDGRTESYKSQAEALQAFGVSKPGAPAAPGAAPSTPIRDTLSAIGTGVLDTVGKSTPAYTPPPDSPAGKMVANREAARATQGATKQAAQQSATAEAKTLADAALKSGDPQDAMAAQDAPGFKYLPKDYQTKIYKLVNGR